jgi:hypothetical protein
VRALRYYFRGWKGMDLICRDQELIGLSAGSVPVQEAKEVSVDEWVLPESTRWTGKYEFYSIMAINAYRQAVRLVIKTAWERLTTEDIEIIFG